MERQTVEIKAEEEIEIKPEIILLNILETVKGIIQDYEFLKVKQEEDTAIKYEEPVEELIIGNECDENYNNPADASSEENVNEDQDKTYSGRTCKVFLDLN